MFSGVSAGVQDTLQGCFLAWPLSVVIPGQPLAVKWGIDALPGLVPGSCLLLGLRGHLQLIPHSTAREKHLSSFFPMPLCCMKQDCKQCKGMDDAQAMPDLSPFDTLHQIPQSWAFGPGLRSVLCWGIKPPQSSLPQRHPQFVPPCWWDPVHRLSQCSLDSIAPSAAVKSQPLKWSHNPGIRGLVVFHVLPPPHLF